MEPIEFPIDFSEFLKLLNAHRVEFLLIGGLAVSHHGYPRSTSDMDVWVAPNRSNAERLVACLREFGFNTPEVAPDLFDNPNRIVRMGVAPVRIEIVTQISGVDFETCFPRADYLDVNGNVIRVISLKDLRANKLASGRPKDLDDLENLPE